MNHTFQVEPLNYANNIAADYIQNVMPNHLLSLQSMELIGKTHIAGKLSSCFKELITAWSTEQLVMLKTEAEELIRAATETECAYGILSHRWLPEGELTFQDMQPSLPVMEELKKIGQQEGGLEAWVANSETNPGLAKIINACQVASQHGCKYLWFDTGCINKASSAELEESIRSMFNWYRDSKLCIVHLAETSNVLDMSFDPWFTRGWTLQELLAPRAIKFYDQYWNPLTPAPNEKIPDVKLGFPLWATIGKITNIPESDLLSFKPGVQNVRERMIWASKRNTTRVEDMAYCLIGIFDVPLPIAYGEGKLAFYRLQLEVMERTNNKALFAWNGLSSTHNSMFAVSPASFSPLDLKGMQDVGLPSDMDMIYTLTNYGLRIWLPFFEVTVGETHDNKYTLEVPELGAIAVIPQDMQRTKPTSLKVALLGDKSFTTYQRQTTSFAILLDYDKDTKQHRRIATETELIVTRPKKIQHALMYIV